MSQDTRNGRSQASVPSGGGGGGTGESFTTADSLLRSFDMMTLLTTLEGNLALMSGGENMGVKINEKVVDLGMMELEALPYEVSIPRGYEVFEENLEKRNRITNHYGLSISLSTPHPFDSKLEVSYVVLPQNNDDRRPYMTVELLKLPKEYIKGDGPGNGEGLTLAEGKAVSHLGQDLFVSPEDSAQCWRDLNSEPFHLHCAYGTDDDTAQRRLNGESSSIQEDCLNLRVRTIIPGGFEGFMGRWIVFVFQGMQVSGPLSVHRKRSTFLSAVRVTGCAVKSGFKKELSIDARPFVPTTLRQYFSSAAISFQVNLSVLCANLVVPPNYQSIRSEVEGSDRIPPQLLKDYEEHHKRKTLRTLLDLAAGMPVMFQPDALEFQHDVAVLKLSRLAWLTWMEEIQMSMDVEMYDCYSVKFDVRKFDDGSSSRTLISKGRKRGPEHRTLLFTFKVLGASESRPKIAIGDLVRVRPTVESIKNPNFLARVKFPSLFELQMTILSFKLATEEVICGLTLPRDCFEPYFGVDTIEKAIRTLSEMTFNVRFTFERCGLAFVHESLRHCIQSQQILKTIYPTAAPRLQPAFLSIKQQIIEASAASSASASTSSRESRRGGNKQFNAEQNRAIMSIVSFYGIQQKLTAGPLPPFCIYGPPGTGKTCTVIAAISAILQRYPRVSILATAPSDAAADVIALRLIKLLEATQPTVRLLRLNWWQRIKASVPAALLGHCNLSPEDLFEIPSYAELRTFEVIVCTCGVAGALRHMRNANQPALAYGGIVFTENKPKSMDFDYVFIDEASQSAETETLIPLSLVKPTGVVVLAGDPKQLGASLRSPAYRSDASSNCSLLERLLASPAYSNFAHPSAGNMPPPPETAPMHDKVASRPSSPFVLPSSSLEAAASVVSAGEAAAAAAAATTTAEATPVEAASSPTSSSSSSSSFSSSSSAFSSSSVAPVVKAVVNNTWASIAANFMPSKASSSSSSASSSTTLKPAPVPPPSYIASIKSASPVSLPADALEAEAAAEAAASSSSPKQANGFASLDTHLEDGAEAAPAPEPPVPVVLTAEELAAAAKIAAREARANKTPRVDLSTHIPVAADELVMGVFLTKNYRSHRKILEVPSRLFYDGALEEYGDEELLDSLLDWEPLQQQDSGTKAPIPMLFVGVDGTHQHDLDSPSFFNISEISTVVDLCTKLVTSKTVKVTTADIGVICAFRAQVLKLRLALRAARLGNINVGSVEDFQGQEVKVIIISTVSSSRPPVLQEQNTAIGLLQDPRRFNVAVTRGQALCLVVGNPFLLHTDPSWREYMEFCDEHGAYVGVHCSLLRRHKDQEREDEDLLNTVAHVACLGASSGKLDALFGFATDMQWRSLL